MDALQLQGSSPFLSVAPRNRYVLLGVIATHLFVIYIVSHIKDSFRHVDAAESALLFVPISIDTSHQKIEPTISEFRPSAISPKNTDTETPVRQLEFNELDLQLDIPVTDYKLPGKKSQQYKDVFDPNLRLRLQALPQTTKRKEKIQYLGVGITLEDIGNGKCLYGNAFEHTGYVVKCGPDEGEQILLNVEKALADLLGL